MTEKRLRKLFAKWQERLGLSNWIIHVVIGGCDDDGEMEVTRTSDYERAYINVQPWIVGQAKQPADANGGLPYTAEDVERTVVHELLHCQVRDLRFADSAFEDHLPAKLNDAWQTVRKSAEEALVDRLAVALVRSWPK